MSNEKILIIEDNDLNMKLVRNLLQLGGFRSLEAVDAESGIRIARDEKPRLILMDIQLPGMDGLTATREIKKDPVTAGIPVIALTSHAMSGDEDNALAAGCSAYITKPVDTRRFIDKIKAYLREDGDSAADVVPADLPPAKTAAHRSRILVVDDDPMNVKLLKAKLSAEGYDVHCAYGGRECMDATAKANPDLILLDVMMPDLDGYAVTERLKGNPQTAHIPIILLTALNGSEPKAMGMEAGADEFLSKPVNTTELLARIRSMLRMRQFQEQIRIRSHSEKTFGRPTGDELPEWETGRVSRVLIVEDDPKDIKLIESHLRGLPVEISVAKDGNDAITYAHRAPVDLILLDVILPGRDGFEICRLLKQEKATRNAQIIMITCLNDLESKIRGVEEGADDFLIKPISSRELVARARSLLKKKAYLDRLQMHYEAALNSAITDGLTSLYNHAYFRRFLDLEVKRSIRQRHSCALIMLDIDDFKRINDTLGHLAGDVILRELSKKIMENVREVDLAARYGGEEFAVVLPYAEAEDAMKAAARLLDTIRSHRFLADSAKGPQQVTVSVGIALCPGDADTSEGLILRADAMLYEAKKEGKDRACSTHPRPEEEGEDRKRVPMNRAL